MVTITKEELVGLLSNGEVVVTFKKKDGTERVMRCTKDFKHIPEENHPKPVSEGTERKPVSNPDLIGVWDLDNNGWRSFDYKSLLNVETNEPVL